MIGQPIEATPYWPPETTPEIHDPNAPSTTQDTSNYPWILVNSTPATCVQIGLSHYFNDRGPIDIIISGPNYGRNTSAVFALSSGTLGAALEAAACGARAIAVSFAFFDRTNDPAIVEECCSHAVRICEWLANEAVWGEGRLYTVNVPVVKGVTERKTSWTKMLQNEWRKGACYQEVLEEGAVNHPETEEVKTRLQTHGEGANQEAVGAEATKMRRFKWAPRFTDVFKAVDEAGPGYDGWVVKEGQTSVTAIYANYKHVEGFDGELDLSSRRPPSSNM